MAGSAPHILMIPVPDQPHIIPMLHLAHQLAESGIRVTFVSFQFVIDRLKLGGNGTIRLVGVANDLPPPSYIPSDIPEHFVVLRESLRLKYNIDSFLETLEEEDDRPTCLLADFLLWWSIDTAAKMNVPRFVLSCNPASLLLVQACSPPKGYEKVGKNHTIHIHDGFPPMLWRNLSPSVKNSRKHSWLNALLLGRWSRSVRESAGVLVNTCMELESDTIKALRVVLNNTSLETIESDAIEATMRSTLVKQKLVLPVGPLGQSPTLPKLRNHVSIEGLALCDEESVTKWLDRHPPRSVLYVSFGTTGMKLLTKRHVHTLAQGLEASQQRFVWVLRAPPNVQNDDPELLPLGFEERVVVEQGRGLLLRGWAPQLRILEHSATGGFLNSCGWNSIMESLARGVPILAWPTYGEQPIISKYVEAKLGVATELLRQGAEKFVEAAEITRAVRMLLLDEEGREMRKRAEKLIGDIATAVAPGGSSPQHLQQFVQLLHDYKKIL